jgi:hypothetical protein
MFQRNNILTPFTESKSKPNNKPADAGGSACCLLLLAFLLGSLVNHEDGGDMFL